MNMRWYYYPLMWLATAAAAWRASPLVMLYAVGLPSPAAFEPLTGTVRVIGTETRTNTGVKAPKYMISTAAGEKPFHCGFRTEPWTCLFSGMPGLSPKVDDVYTISYHWYWGVNYMKHPQRLAAYDANWEPNLIASMRKKRAAEGVGSLGLLMLLLALQIFFALRKRSASAKP